VTDAATPCAAARSRWPGRRTTLARQTDAALVLNGTAAERVAMVWQITQALWASAGRPIPDYDRPHMPGRVLRGHRG